MDLSEKGVIRFATTDVTVKEERGVSEAPTAETEQATEGVVEGLADGGVDVATGESSDGNDVFVIDDVITVIEISSDEEDTSTNMLPQDDNRADILRQEGNSGNMSRQRYKRADILRHIEKLSNINKERLQRAYEQCLARIREGDGDSRGLSAYQVQQIIDQEMNENTSMQPPSPDAGLPAPEQN